MFITDFILKVFNAIVQQRNRALEQALQRDPEFQKISAELEKIKARLDEHIQLRLKEDPELARRYERLSAIFETKEVT